MGSWNLKIPATVFFLIISFSARATLNDEFIAAVEGLASVEKVASLIEAGADVNAVFPNKCNGGTALMCAAQSNSGGYESKVRLLLSHGADVEIRNGAGQTALMAAATNLERIGGEAVFELLLDHGANVNAKTVLGNTPLHFAACDDLAWSALSEPTVVPSITSPGLGGGSSSYKGIQTLLRSGADPAAVNQDGDTPLHIVLQTYKLSFPSATDAVRALLQAGADATQKDGEGIAPLHFVVAKAETGDVIRELLDAGADPDLKDSKGKTPLHIAAKLDRDENAKALLKGGADPDLKDSKGDTPLHIVVTSESSDVVDALLVAKANPCIKDAEGYTPYQRADEETYIHQALGRAGGYDAACDERREEKEEFTSEKQQAASAEKSQGGAGRVASDECKDHICFGLNWKIATEEDIRWLKSTGNVNAKSDHGATPLHYAAWNENPAITTALIEAGADLEARDKNSWTPLHWAGWYNESPAITTTLLEAGADVHAKDNNGRTPLHWVAQKAALLQQVAQHDKTAAQHDKTAVINALIEAGADVNAKDNAGLTPKDDLNAR